MTKAGNLILAAVVAGAIAFAAFALWSARPPAPQVTFVSLQGEKITTASLRGKVVLVNFWATWCPYCRHEMPAMEAFYRANRERGFEIVAYSLDKTQAEADAYLRQEGYTFPAPLISREVSEAFGGVERVPLSFVIDRQGVIRHKIAGQVHPGRLDDLITPLLAAPATAGSR